MDETALRLGVGELIAAYADCIDDDRLEEWPDFFTEDCRYLIHRPREPRRGLAPWHHLCRLARHAGRPGDGDARANIYEAQRYRHIVGPVRIDRVEGGSPRRALTFSRCASMHDGDSQLFATGRYLDRIDVSATPFRFIERTIVLDSQKIDTLLVIPL